ncbi:NAD kinase [candidate division KSB1 bacterium]
MKIAIFGKVIHEDGYVFIQELVDKIYKINGEVWIYEPFFIDIKDHIILNEYKLFKDYHDLKENVQFLISLGGDGTMLDTISLVRDSGIPILGVNMGRLGFLASINKERIILAVESLQNGAYKLDKRTLINIINQNELFGKLNYALNDVTIYKKDPMTMITIKVFINDEFLNSYWADGLLIATPTGSTAYSLSCGGPILTPDSNNLVITPIANHNLSVRPVVIPDSSIVRVRVVGRENSYFVGLDSRSKSVESSTEISIQKADFKINLVQMSDDNFFNTIRDKLMWGLDLRN